MRLCWHNCVLVSLTATTSLLGSKKSSRLPAHLQTLLKSRALGGSRAGQCTAWIQVRWGEAKKEEQGRAGIPQHRDWTNNCLRRLSLFSVTAPTIHLLIHWVVFRMVQWKNGKKPALPNFTLLTGVRLTRDLSVTCQLIWTFPLECLCFVKMGFCSELTGINVQNWMNINFDFLMD